MDNIEMNINEYVEVKLTVIGRVEHELQHQILRCDMPILGEYIAPVEDSEGWSRWQFHDLMNTFGHMMIVGGEPPFETEIRIPLRVV